MTGTRGRAVALLAALALLAAAVAGCGGDGGGGDGGGGETTEPPATATTTEGGAATGGDAEAGAAVWQEAGCGSCHVLSAAGSQGSVGPNLDDLQPGLEQTVEQVTNGGGGMPAFADQLSEQQILDVSAYVVESTGG